MTFDFKLSTRILMGYLIPMVAVAVAGMTVYNKASQMHDALIMVDEASVIVDHGTKLEVYGTRLQSVARGLLLQPDASRYREFEEAKSGVKSEIEALTRAVKDKAQLETLASLKQLSQQIEDATQAEIDLLKQGKKDEAVALFMQAGSGQYYADFTRVHKAFFDREREIQTARSERATQAADEMTTVAWQAIAIVLALSLVAAWVLSRQIGRRINNLTASIATSTQEIVATTAEHERAMEEQASSVAETSSTVEEVITTAKSNSEQAELAAGLANDSQTTVAKGLELSEQNRQEMGNLEAAMVQFAEQIGALAEQASQIGEISRVVSELSAQTNMLALNAAVEASRAGEQGKGFAVVASEIRKLADQSKKSATNATEIVADIQKATDRMVASAEQSTGVTHTVAASVQQVVDAFERVKELTEGVHLSAQQVQLNSKQQAAALSQVGGAMSSINDGARAMATGTVQIRAGMERLAEVTHELSRLA